MKRSILFLSFLLALLPFMNGQNKSVTQAPLKVEVYYFHPTERCPIDQAIEENIRQTVQTYFSREVKNGVIQLQILNTDDKANAKIVRRFDINAQALYLVNTVNGKEIKTDLTAFAFDYGKTDPQKFKMRLKDEIEGALK
jgi:hypothetical protein